MRGLIIGGGAIGQYMAARLTQGGQEAVIMARPTQADTINANGVALQVNGSMVRWPVRAIAEANDTLLRDPFELVIVAVKAYSTGEAVRTISSIAACSQASILTVQNGLGNEEELAEAFGADRVIAGALTVAVDRLDATTVAATKKGGLCISPVGRSAHNWVIATMSSSGIPVRAISSWRALKWSKLCINILGNGVCAALDWLPEQVYANPLAFSIEHACLRETIAVMEKLELTPVNLIDFPAALLVRAARLLPAPILRTVLKRRVASGRGGKLPSLLMDLRAGRPQTEVMALNGAVALNAVRAGIQAPANAKISSVVSAVASGQTSWDDYRSQPSKLM